MLKECNTPTGALGTHPAGRSAYVIQGRSNIRVIRSGKGYASLFVYCDAVSLPVSELKSLSTESNGRRSLQEDERCELAREIHDELGQMLTLLKLDLARIRENLASRAAPEESVTSGLDLMAQSINTALETVRKISTSLRPAVLSEGLVAALEWQVRSFQQRTGIRCRLDFYGGDSTLHPDLSGALFRIVQEALTNVVRHSDATEVRVRVERKGDHLIVIIKDNGRGIRTDEFEKKSYGLAGIWERAIAWGGRVNITGIAGGGTWVWVKVPLANGYSAA
ncbi:MAG TPA: sensor histidine kinase [Acidobacteriota bacterium]|jgi:signal transduction histidine kinase